MSIRSFEDVVRVIGDNADLYHRILKLLSIYKKTEIVNIPRFSYIRIEKIQKNSITISLHKIREDKYYRQEPIIGAGAGPCGFGGGWVPQSEDIIGYKDVYDNTTWGIEQIMEVTIPESDIGIVDDSELINIENRYIQMVKERKEAEAQKALALSISNLEKELEEKRKKLKNS
jgi:hypothetical protein